MAIDTTKTINIAKVLASTHVSGVTSDKLNVTSIDGLFTLGYDSTTGTIFVTEQDPLWAKNTDSENLVTAQDFITGYTQAGSNIDVRDFSRLEVGLIFTANDNSGSTNNIKFLSNMDNGAVNYGKTTASDYIYEVGGVDVDTGYSIDVLGKTYITVWIETDLIVSTQATATINIAKQY